MALDRLTKVTGSGIKTDTNWVGNNANFTGITTAGSSFNVGVTTFHSTLAEVHNIKSTGIITATGGSFSGNVTAVDGTFTGNVSIAGTLTYEDVTNIDSVGIITAPAVDVDDFLDVGSNIKLGNAGVITATSFVGSGAALTGIDATAIKDSGGNVKIQAQASGAIHSGVSTFQDIDVDGHTNLDNVSIAGVTTTTDDIIIGADNKKLKLGTGEELELYQAGNHSIIQHNGNHFLLLRSNSVQLQNAAGTKSIFQGFGDTHSSMYYNGSYKIRTQNTGAEIVGTVVATGADINGDIDVDGHTNLDNVSIAGVVTATTFSGSGASLTNIPSAQLTGALPAISGANLTGINVPGGGTNLDLLDSSGTGNGRIRLGASQDLQIYHDGSHSWLKNTTGRLLLQTDGDQIQLRGNSIVAFNGAASTEYLRITSDGDVDVATGHLQAQDIKIGLLADRYPIIQRAVQSSGSQSLTITGGSGYSEHTGTNHVVTDARQGAMIQLVGGNPTSDTYGGGIRYYAAGHTSPNNPGTGNQHTFYTRSGVDTNTERFRINHDGKIGASHNLAGTADYNRLMLHNPASGSCWMQLTSTATGSTPNTDGLSIGLNTSNIAHIWLRENAEMHFATNNSLRWRITSSGDVYPQGNYKIGLNSNTAFRMDEVNSNKFVHRYGNSGSATNNQQEAIWYGGGITTMHDNATLSTSNYTWGLTGSRGYALIRVRNNSGQAIYAESGSITSGSDYRMKENIEEITNGIETVKKLKPSIFNIRKTFNPNDDGKKHHGFIAHEVQEAIPDIGNIVSGTKDAMEEVFYGVDEDDVIPDGKKAGDSTGTFTDKPDYQGIDYGHMTPVLAAAIKELITKVETLESKVSTLEGS